MKRHEPHDSSSYFDALKRRLRRSRAHGALGCSQRTNDPRTLRSVQSIECWSIYDKVSCSPTWNINICLGVDGSNHSRSCARMGSG